MKTTYTVTDIEKLLDEATEAANGAGYQRANAFAAIAHAAAALLAVTVASEANDIAIDQHTDKLLGY
jgi:hypothetical protein